MKDEAIDLMRSVKPSEFTKMLKSKSFNEKYILKAEDQLSYTYIGVNTKNEILEDKLVRKAIAHLVDVDQIIETLFYGYARRITSFVHPSKSYYNDTLKTYDFSLEKAITTANNFTGFNVLLKNDDLLKKTILIKLFLSHLLGLLPFSYL